MDNNQMTRRDFLKGAGILAAGALVHKFLHGKVYIPYVFDAFEEEDKYDVKGEIISLDNLKDFYLLDYVQPYEISGIGDLSSQYKKPNLVTFIEKEQNLYQKVYLIVNQGDNIMRCRKERGQRYTEEGIQRFFNNKKEILNFTNVEEYIKQLGVEKDHYSADEIYEIMSSYQHWNLDYSSENERVR